MASIFPPLHNKLISSWKQQANVIPRTLIIIDILTEKREREREKSFSIIAMAYGMQAHLMLAFKFIPK